MTNIYNLVPTNTPWGEIQDQGEIMPDVIQVNTSGHGGIWLNEQRSAQIPDYLKKHSCGGAGIWWEEDCAWSLPILYLLSCKKDPGHEDIFLLESAADTAREWYPPAYKKIRRAARGQQ
jgi:hypothetical protein